MSTQVENYSLAAALVINMMMIYGQYPLNTLKRLHIFIRSSLSAIFI